MGRQFMVCSIVFIINMSGGPIADAELWGLSDTVKNVFFGSGLAMILFTCMVGQLNSQVNASLNTLDYCNNYFAMFTFWVAMAIEFSGLLHASYVCAMIADKVSGQTTESKEPPRTLLQNLFFWGRCLLSLAVLGYCCAVTF